MKTSFHNAGFDAANLNRVHDLALQRAGELRADAIRDFWHGADAVLAVGLASASRSARRLSQRLARHKNQRSLTIE